MRSYAVFEAENRAALAANSVGLKALFRNWINRRQLRKLSELDDYLLQDIGVSRTDLENIANLPLAYNPATELVRIRNRGRRHVWDE